MHEARVEVRPATTERDLERYAAVVNTVTPEDPTSVEEIRWSDAAYPGGQRFLAWLDGEAVGAAGAGRVYMYPPEFEGLWSNLSVLAEHRRRGVGSALLETISDAARAAGKTLLLGRTSAEHGEAIEFLEHRGFREFERMKVVRLDLVGVAAPAIDPPAGVVITSLAEHPELVSEVYEVAREALPDIPAKGPSTLPDTLAEFRLRDVDRPNIPPAAFELALDGATGTVIGYANLLIPGRPKVAWHSMTAVARAWRGRGVASALKRATIRWAVEHGLEAVETANDTENEPMRAVNRRLGYVPLPDDIEFRGPLWPPRPAAGSAA